MPVNGGIIGKVNTPRSSSASGVWGILDLFLARTQSTWPSAGGYTVIQTFTATSTWTCPTGVTSVDYLVVGGVGLVQGLWTAVFNDGGADRRERREWPCSISTRPVFRFSEWVTLRH